MSARNYIMHCISTKLIQKFEASVLTIRISTALLELRNTSRKSLLSRKELNTSGEIIRFSSEFMALRS